MLTLNDGRSELWQWDTGRTLSVDADCSQVHFSNKVFGRSIDVDVVDGSAVIPDILLQTDKDLNVWAFVGTAENGYTKISKTFTVNRRNKPADYVFTPTDQITLAELSGRLDRIEESQDPDAIKNAVEDYLAQNPVEIPVKSVNGKTGTVELNAEDVGAISQDALQDATNEALAQAKASGEFDGADGAPGKDGADGHPGENGTDGYSPTANVTQNDNGATITITDKNGTTTATVTNGKDGADGNPGADGSPGKDGADGKSAYAYAVEGGYTGTEAEFAAKLAQEKFANPNALTFTGAVTGSYDGSEPVTVEIPSGGGERTFEKVVEMTTAEDAAVISISTDKNGNLLSMSEFYMAITTARNSEATKNNYFNCNVLPDTVPSYRRDRSAIKKIDLFQDVYCYVMHYKVVGGMIFHEYTGRARTSSGLNVAKYLENEKEIGFPADSGRTIGFLSPTDTTNGESKIDSAGKMYCITFSADSTECIFGAGTRVEVWAR